MRRKRRPDPYAILGEDGRQPRVRTAIIFPVLVLVIFVALLAYIALFGGDELTDAPPGVRSRLH